MIAQDPLSLVFIFCFLVGFGFFLVATLAGGHGHGHAHAHIHVGHLHVHLPGVHHAPAHGASHAPHAATHNATHAPSAQNGANSTNNQQNAQQTAFALGTFINPTSIALFLLGFGFFGYLFHNLTPGLASLSLLLALIAGIVLSVTLLSTLSRLVANVESSTEQDVVDRTGMLGKVSLTIPEKGLGEIIYTSPGGMRKSIPARGLDNQRLERDLEVVVVNYENGVAEVDTWEHFMNGETHLPDPASAEELPQLHVLLNQSDVQAMEMLIRQEQQKE
ncbi:MAG TPA: hypothetical protein VF458_22000 [Ktedonobacteraceae bacterium]